VYWLLLAVGDDEDYSKAALEANPGSTLSKDKNGNPMLTLADGKQAYINKPGLDAEDVTRFAGKAGSFAVGGLAAGAGKAFAVGRGILSKAAGTGLAARTAAGAAGGAAGDAALQKLAGREDIDGQQVAETAALGAGAGAVGPALGKAFNWAKKKFGVDKWSRLKPEKQKQIIETQLKKDGITPEDLNGLPDKWEFGLNRLEVDDLVSPEASLANKEFGYQVSKGQGMPTRTSAERTARFSQLKDEEYLKNTDQGQRLKDIDKGNLDKTDENIKNILAEFGGGKTIGDTRNRSANIVQEGLSSVENSMVKRYQKAFDKAESLDMDFDKDWVDNIADGVKARLDADKVRIPKIAKAGRAALKDLKNIEGASLKDLNDQKKMLSQFYEHASTKGDRYAVNKVKKAFEAEMNDAIDAHLYTGDPRAVTALKKANRLFADYAKQFRDPSKVGKKIENLLEMDADPAEVANLFYGVRGIAPKGSVKLVKKYKSIVGKDSEAFQALRETYLHTILVNQQSTNTKGADALVKTLKNALDNSGEALVKELYTKKELAKLRRFSKALEAIVPDPEFRKTSGSAERFFRGIETSVWANAPGVKLVTGVFLDLAKRQMSANLSKAPKQVGPVLNVLPAGGAYTATSE